MGDILRITANPSTTHLGMAQNWGANPNLAVFFLQTLVWLCPKKMGWVPNVLAILIGKMESASSDLAFRCDPMCWPWLEVLMRIHQLGWRPFGWMPFMPRT